MKTIQSLTIEIILIALVANVSANASAPIIIKSDPQIKQINMNNLSSADSSADELLKLKRKVELEKANAELKKLQNSANGKNLDISPGNVQTTVTGVAINQQDEKIAWLQFADGGSLTVNIGSKVGQYTVSDISMTGVTLSESSNTNHDRGKSVFLKRAYYAPEKSQQNNQHGNTLFAPSPIITNANTGSGNEVVPPIVTVR